MGKYSSHRELCNRNWLIFGRPLYYSSLAHPNSDSSATAAAAAAAARLLLAGSSQWAARSNGMGVGGGGAAAAAADIEAAATNAAAVTAASEDEDVLTGVAQEAEEEDEEAMGCCALTSLSEKVHRFHSSSISKSHQFQIHYFPVLTFGAAIAGFRSKMMPLFLPPKQGIGGRCGKRVPREAATAELGVMLRAPNSLDERRPHGRRRKLTHYLRCVE